MKTFFVTTAVVGALVIFAGVLYGGFFSAPSDEIALPLSVAQSLTGENLLSADAHILEMQAAEMLPAKLLIPSISVNAKVQHVGITKKGNMATPRNFSDVGWYKYGTVPGRLGSAVIAGHVDNGFALPGVFKHLERVQKGDDVYVEMENGDVLHYIVTGFSTYDYDADAKTVFGEKDKRYLKLITCTGAWMPQHRTHDKRLVVTAVEV